MAGTEELPRWMSWTPREVGFWLSDVLGLPTCANTFVAKCAYGPALLELTDASLEDTFLINNAAHRKLVLAGIEMLPCIADVRSQERQCSAISKKQLPEAQSHLGSSVISPRSDDSESTTDTVEEQKISEYLGSIGTASSMNDMSNVPTRGREDAGSQRCRLGDDDELASATASAAVPWSKSWFPAGMPTLLAASKVSASGCSRKQPHLKTCTGCPPPTCKAQAYSQSSQQQAETSRALSASLKLKDKTKTPRQEATIEGTSSSAGPRCHARPSRFCGAMSISPRTSRQSLDGAMQHRLQTMPLAHPVSDQAATALQELIPARNASSAVSPEGRDEARLQSPRCSFVAATRRARPSSETTLGRGAAIRQVSPRSEPRCVRLERSPSAERKTSQTPSHDSGRKSICGMRAFIKEPGLARGNAKTVTSRTCVDGGARPWRDPFHIQPLVRSAPPPKCHPRQQLRRTRTLSPSLYRIDE